ncbi:hypothetical protein UCRNP2_3687 [Neofusicoccum parvum UCRNP2]|uniref:Uncharacterized protein n=1 Tax=Botryosphaeria parva (strain UCR-NP2) TaxID=1287680 RepID=R1GMN6_BOTPV|nr:hypothetical protein UCRNP2_3687 [Neofusicoccum parvum UCRNP2]
MTDSNVHPAKRRRKSCLRLPKQNQNNSKSARMRKIFPWTELPGELRNTVYEIALTATEPIHLQNRIINGKRVICPDKSFHGCLTLITKVLLLNKATFSEAAPILYENDFVFADSMAFYHFMAKISPASKLLIENVTLISRLKYHHSATGYMLPTFHPLIELRNLKRFTLSNYITKWDVSLGGIDHIAEHIYRDAYIWFEAVGRAKGNKTAGVDIFCIDDEIEADWVAERGKVQAFYHDRFDYSLSLIELIRQVLKKLILKDK